MCVELRGGKKKLTQTLTVRMLRTHFSTPILDSLKPQQNIIELVTRPGHDLYHFHWPVEGNNLAEGLVEQLPFF